MIRKVSCFLGAVLLWLPLAGWAAAPLSGGAAERDYVRILNSAADIAVSAVSKTLAVEVLQSAEDCRSAFLKVVAGTGPAGPRLSVPLEIELVPSGGEDSTIGFGYALTQVRGLVRIGDDRRVLEQNLAPALVRAFFAGMYDGSPEDKNALAAKIPAWLVAAVLYPVISSPVDDAGTLAFADAVQFTRYLNAADLPMPAEARRAHFLFKVLVAVLAVRGDAPSGWLEKFERGLLSGLNSTAALKYAGLDSLELMAAFNREYKNKNIVSLPETRLGYEETVRLLSEIFRLKVREAGGVPVGDPSGCAAVVDLPIRTCCKQSVARAQLFRIYPALVRLRVTADGHAAGFLDLYIRAMYLKKTGSFWRLFKKAEKERKRYMMLP